MNYTVHGIVQARILEWVAFPFSRGIFPIQGSNPGLQHCRQTLYQLSHKGSPRMMEWVACPFSRGSSHPGIKPRSPALQADSLPVEPQGKPKNTGVGSLSLLQGIFPTQGSNPGLPHCGQILYQLSHKGSPRILEWVDYPFSRGSSRPRNQTRVSCIAGRFFTNWAMREL